MSDEGRQCYICLEEDGKEAEWVSPCRCAGSIRWVHRKCLIRWVREQESKHPWKPVTCLQCKTKFRLTPETGLIVTTFEFIDTVVYPFFKFKAGCFFGIIAFDAAFTTIGIYARSQVYGLEEILNAVSEMNKIELVTYLNFPVILLLLVNSIRWERSLLDFLRRFSRLPIGVGCLLPEDVPDRFKLPKRLSFTRNAINTILLPFIARLVGNLCFSFVDSQGYRVLFGGLTFLAVKGTCSMYLLHKLEMRRKKMIITPYRSSIRPSFSE